MSTLTETLAGMQAKTDAATPGEWAVDDGWKHPQWPEVVTYTRVVAGEPNPISGIRQPVVTTEGAIHDSDSKRGSEGAQ